MTMDQYNSKTPSPHLELPDASSPSLQLSHPTDSESETINDLQSAEWRGALTIPQFKEERAHLRTVPLAKDNGMTEWVLVDKHSLPGQRPVLASCRTLRKRSLTSDPDGNVSEFITHGVNAVYCRREYRRRGYASRMLQQLGEILPKWQTGERKCIASVLYSDIGGDFYARLGWHPVLSHHIAFDSTTTRPCDAATPLFAGDLEAVCDMDERLVRESLARPSHSSKMRFAILPDVDHMRWHHAKEEFACPRLFGRAPEVKGAMAGQPGKRVWAIWTHRFYEFPGTSGRNVLYILRLVLEARLPDAARQDADVEIQNLKLVLEAARAEAAEWDIPQVQLWDPSPVVAGWVEKTGITHRAVNRTGDSLACLRWYGGGSEKGDAVEWVYNEKYAWC